MKKFYPYLILMILLLALSGCDLVDSEMDNDEDTSGATLSPMTNAEALSLYMQVDDALYAAFDDNGYSLPNETSVQGINDGVDILTETDGRTLSWQGAYGGGNVDIKAIFTDTLTEPVEGSNLAPGNTYDDLYKYISTTLISKASAADEAGTIENVVLTIKSIDYTVSAEITVDSSLEYTIDVVTGETTDDPITYRGGYSFSTDFYFTTTVEREDGSGTSMTIQYSSNDPDSGGPIEGDNIELTGFSYESQDYNPVIAALEEELANVSVSLAVVNFDTEENINSSEYFLLSLGDFFSATTE